MAIKRMVNITFQVCLHNERWEEAPIIYVDENVPVDKDISEIVDILSTVFGYVTIRSARLFLNDPITPKKACDYNGGYYQAKPKFYDSFLKKMNITY